MKVARLLTNPSPRYAASPPPCMTGKRPALFSAREIFSASRINRRAAPVSIADVTSQRSSDMETRRDLLKCMAWAGTGVFWTVSGGVPEGVNLGGAALAAPAGGFSFVQISDTPYGLQGRGQPRPERHPAGCARQDRRAAQQAGDDAAYRRRHPSVESGRVRHRRPDHQGREARHPLHPRRARRHRRRRQRVSSSASAPRARRRAAGTASTRAGCISSALVNVMGFKPATGGSLGKEQIAWLEQDLKGKSASTPIVVMAPCAAVAGLPAMGLGHRAMPTRRWAI